MNILSNEQAISKLNARSLPANYWGYYSSLLGGVSLDPRWMMLNVDDHGFHRGDAVFEALKVCNGGVYLLQQHLDRLQRSAERIELRLPCSLPELKERVLETCKLVLQAKNSDAANLRVFLTRGSGSFGPSPADCPQSELFIVVMAPSPANPQKAATGVSLGRSQIPIKPGFFSQVKSCNYLPNVMMKLEAAKRGVDYTIGFTGDGELGEAPTENIIVLNEKNELLHPRLSHILDGTTMLRLFDLVQQKKVFATRVQDKLTEKDLLGAKALMLVGTTLDVLFVRSYEQKHFSFGSEISTLNELLHQDQKKGSAMLTPYA